ncbi:MAG: glycosyltransferase [Verrucomicrobiales bacterium]
MTPSAVPTPLPHVTAHGKFFRAGGEPWLLKGLAYGPFAGPEGLPAAGQVERDLRQIAGMGCNTLRLYRLPPPWFLDACAAHGLRVLVGWPWPMHTDFLRDRRQAREILSQVRAVVRALGDSPAILGCVVGNEVPAELVRWMGPSRVQRFLERMIDVGRRHAPAALWAYASFPSTECLNPRNADFTLCNIYLEDRTAFTRYLSRQQLLAGDKPLVIGEFGLDTHRHGESRQAEALGWAWGAVVRTGLAGQVIFSFTDEWFNHGRPMESEWAFGVTTAPRRPKEAVTTLTALLPSWRRPGEGVRLHRFPRFSIIICSYNGARSLRHALESVQYLPYPDYEVLLVDDGSTDRAIATLAAEFREVRSFHITHGGLSRARNFGATQATGSILVYLDDDAIAEGDWLTYLALSFEDDRVGAAGGPNIPPLPTSWKQAALACSPGGPAVVMLNDVDAEHVPGCNLAVTRAAWQEVGGFDERHHTAGDDVDFCWRLIDHGYRIAYQPGAMVWHERRSSVRTYLRQQIGYGRAEAALIAQHPHRFDRFGGAQWRGRIYEPGALAKAETLIYGGLFGTAPYQFLYAHHPIGIRAFVRSAAWVFLALAIMAAGVWHPAFAWLGSLLILPAITSIGRLAARIPLAPWPGATWASRWAARTLLAAMAFVQPIARGGARLQACLSSRAWPLGRTNFRPLIAGPWPGRRKAIAEIACWHEDDKDRTALLANVMRDLAASGATVAPGDEWADWDLESTQSPWWSVRLVTATEYHAPQGRLTRVRLTTRARRSTIALAVVGLLAVAGLFGYDTAVGLWAFAVSFLIWLALENRHGAAATRVLRLVLASARALGWHSVPESHGNSSGGRRSGVYNVTTPDRANPSPP